MAARPTKITFSSEDRVMGALLLLVPITFVAAKVGWPSSLQFFLSVGAIIPLAAFIGTATEALAERLGGKVGGLLNATFGNSPDLLVGYFGVQRGLIPLVKATLVGAMISNSALIMGLCYIVAGLKYGRPRFSAREAGHHSVLMLLTVAAVLFPTVGSLAMCGGKVCSPSSRYEPVLLHVSVGISITLLLGYVAYVLYGIFGLERLGQPEEEGRDTRHLVERPREGRTLRPVWPAWFGVAILAGATVCLVPITDILTGSVDPVTSVLGWTQVFVGMIIVANAGNVAEGYAAIKLSAQRQGVPEDRPGGESGLDLALGIASASSIQIATFIAPVIVLYSLFTTHSMNLVFSPVEVGILALLVALFAYIAQDGESNWLEGAQLLVLYAMAAVMFFALPVWVFGS